MTTTSMLRLSFMFDEHHLASLHGLGILHPGICISKIEKQQAGRQAPPRQPASPASIDSKKISCSVIVQPQGLMGMGAAAKKIHPPQSNSHAVLASFVEVGHDF